jgi:glycosyltransferase involved in cell wall biosynthesis
MIRFIGKISRDEVNELYGNSRAGIVIYQPAANHLEAQPIKLFEFMAAGLPVVASDFPLWREIVEGNQCGICVNPTDPEEVKVACLTLIDNPKMAQALGRNGKAAIDKQYNWKSEENKLVELYNQL